MIKKTLPFTLLLSLLITITAGNAVEFDIYQSGHKPLRMAWNLDTNSTQTGAQEKIINHTFKDDLESSESFTLLDPMSFIGRLGQGNTIDYADWRIIGTDIIVQCHIDQLATPPIANIIIHDPFQQKELIRYTLTQLPIDPRRLAHAIANSVYEKIIGIPGHFSSHILFVQQQHNRANLIFMDQDGHNQQIAASNFELILSPDWSSDGRHVAINSYIAGQSRLEQLDLSTGRMSKFAGYKGLNSTPEYSPDGRYIAAALSHTGNVEIHIFDTQTNQWRQFTHQPGIDTSPTWSPDGKSIAFVSNRSGNPHIYIQEINSNTAKRITRATNYNTSPAWSPRGDRIAIITKKGWEYALATIKTDGSDIRYLVTGTGIESPSWSPNGQMLLYSQEINGLKRVYRIPNWGGNPHPITAAHIDASDPAWSKN